VPTTERAEVQAAWRAMSRRYGWSLVSDEAALVERALSECQQLSTEGKPAAARLGVWRVYGALIHTYLLQGSDQAAQEVWRMFAYTAMRWGWQQPEAEELAQEAVARVLTKITALKSPAGFLTWALRVLSTIRKEAQTSEPSESLSLSSAAQAQPDDQDLAYNAEQRHIEQDIAAQLRAFLPNEFERAVLMRVLISGEKPRDIASALGIPMARVRLAKSRALQRLRNEPAFIEWLHNLGGDDTRAMGDSGAPNNDR